MLISCTNLQTGKYKYLDIVRRNNIVVFCKEVAIRTS